MATLAEQISHMSPLKLALATQQLAPKMALANAEPIAVVGMGCRFPGGVSNPDEFWRLLREGRDAIVDIASAGRWNADAYYDADPDAPGKMSVQHGGFLQDVDQFDAQFFGISPREAAVLDPQQRLLMEVTWEALENAGMKPGSLHNSATGVYVGITTSEYEKLCLQSDIALQTDNQHVAYMGTGNDTCAAAGRLSYSLGLTGPSLSVNTACSSSLVATHLACESLRHRSCRMALAGGVNLTLIPDIYVVFSKAGMLSPGGRCRTFDAAADGYVRGEGCGVLVLKRLSDAVADGDNVLALIRGSAVNQDGKSSGLTVPNGPSQQAVVQQALDNAGILPSQVGYVEAHGTGTSLGDPIEVGALAGVFRERTEPLLIGSVKTNIGHLESGAGAAGLIKTILSLQHGEIPRNLHFDEPSPHIGWDKMPIRVVTEKTAWPAERRIAGVSSFGYSGTNAHIVLEAAPATEPAKPNEIERPMHLLALSTRTQGALADAAAKYANFLQQSPQTSLADLCASANSGRTLFAHRMAIAASNTEDLQKQLAAFAAGEKSQVITGSENDLAQPKIGFLFTGQGSQYAGMARELYETQPLFKQTLDQCDELLRGHLEVPLLDVLYPDHANGEVSADLINQTAYTQPCLFALEYALATLWRSWGIEPDLMLGHSVGEYAAACIAGVFSLEDGLKLITARARLMQALPQDGTMLAAKTDQATAEAAIQDYADTVSLAAINGPKSVVISGKVEAVHEIGAKLKGQGISTKELVVSHAFHSPAMEPMLNDFRKVAESITFSPPKLGVISNVTGDKVTDEITQPDYWVKHLRYAVHFNDGMQSMEKHGCNVYIEIGANPIMLGMGRLCVNNDNTYWLPSLRAKKNDWTMLLNSLGELFAHGVTPDWQGFEQGYNRQKIALPTYPFQRQRHWLPQTGSGKKNSPALRPLVDKLIKSPLIEQTIIETEFSANALPFLQDHKVFDEIVAPGASHIALLLSGAELLGMQGCQLEDVVFPAPLTLAEGETRLVQAVLSPNGDDYDCQLISTPAANQGEESVTHATGHLVHKANSNAETIALADIQARCTETIDPDELYEVAAAQFIVFGPSFRWIDSLQKGDGEALARFSRPENIDMAGYWLHPGLLDACFQTAGITLDEDASAETLLPFMLKRLQIQDAPQGNHWWCHVKQTGEQAWDIRLLDDDGRVLLALDGFEMRAAPRNAMRHVDWLYKVEWQARPSEFTGLPASNGVWLIFANMTDDLGDQLAKQLHIQNQSYVLVKPGNEFTLNDMDATINADQAEDYQHLMDQAFVQSNRNCAGVVYLWSITPGSDDLPTEAQSLGVHAMFTVWALRQADRIARLWLFTQGAQAVASEPSLQVAQAGIWGFGRSLAIEQPDLHCTLVDLSPEPKSDNLTALLTELGTQNNEDQIAWRGDTRHVARLTRYQTQQPTQQKPEGPFRVQLAGYGSPDELRLVEMERRAPGTGEVEIEVHSTALNFRDVLNSLGMLKEYYAEVLNITRAQDIPLGFECAGTVVAVGPDVADLKIGDPVVAAAQGSFSSHVTVEAYSVARKPDSLSFEAASGTPTAFLTAWYALRELAKTQAGDKVLIHSAAGGVGQAAVQIAQAVGAEIFATASTGKWEVLRAQGIQHVFNSRNLDFAEAIQKTTDGQGVDVILNSLNGEFIDKSFEVLAQGGRFVEIGKIGIWDIQKAAQLRPDAQYYPFDLGEVTSADHDLMTSMLNAVMRGFDDGSYKPLPQVVFPITEVADAYRYMQQTKHIGKVVLSLDEVAAPGIKPEASYLVTGGLGGLGIMVARYLAEQGARYLVLTGRSGARTDEAKTLVADLTAQGITVEVVKGDVADAEDVERMIAAANGQAPLAGVIHAAGLVDDAALMQQTPEHFARVMAPKVQGVWHLHQQIRQMPLDYFIGFSSIASLMGSPGQTNYAAANAVMDLLLHQRHLSGLPGMSINWGPWAEAGMAADMSFDDEGLDKISIQAGIEMLDNLLHMPAYRAPDQIGVFPMHWGKFMRQFAPDQVPGFISLMQRQTSPKAKAKKAPASADILHLLADTPSEQRQTTLAKWIGDQLSQVLGLDTNVPIDQHWNELGLDSLMTVELKNRIDRALNVSVPLETIMQEATTQMISAMVMERLADLDEKEDAPAEDAFEKHQAELDAEVAMVHDIPQTYVVADEQRNRQVMIDGAWRCDFASCNYLGMDLEEEVMQAIPAALKKWGVHPSWTRAVASPELYAELERELAELVGAPHTIVFPSIHLLHFGILPMLAGFNGVILKDTAAHHSIYEACLRAQADGVEWTEFAHNDLTDLERKLSRYRPEQTKIIAIDGVYSMSGGFPPLPEISALAKQYNALVYIDDAHGMGVIGANPSTEMPYGHGGCGIVRYYGLDYESDRILYVAGLSKSFSSYGAFITCFDQAMKDRFGLAGPFVFSGPSPVASLASALAGLQVNKVKGEAKRQQVYQLTHKLVTGAEAIGFEVDNDNDFPIVGVVIGDIEQVTAACKLLWEYNILITPAIYPAVPMQRNLVRFSITSANTEAEIDQALQGLQAVWQQIHATRQKEALT
jgi:acyl transferase domain-containing protein/7-keto-8-aminopelargonate synthetase-like enzyme/acyl carrier protein